MKKDALRGAEKYTKEHQRKKRWYRVVTCLACVVVFCTVYALILPAITLEKGACEIPEHTHSEACYTQVTSTRTEPVCTIESLNLHQHDDTCYDSEGNLTCGYADFVVHRHDSSCYDEDGNLWCPLPEIETHEHTDSCYSVPETGEPELICDKTEVILHEHTSDCFDDAGNLICGKIQVLEHQHTDACFETVEEPVDADTLTCTLPEDENHTHGPLCYGNWELTCGMEEHTHSEECQSTEEALEQGNLNMLPLNIGSAADPLTKYAIVGTETSIDGVLTAEGADYRITVTYTDEAEIPNGSTLEVREIKEGTSEYNRYEEQTSKIVYAEGDETAVDHDPEKHSVSFARFFDISIIDKDGNEIEPKATVETKIEAGGINQIEGDVNIIHFKDHEDEPEMIPAERDEDGSVVYKQDSFSVVGFYDAPQVMAKTANIVLAAAEGEEDGPAHSKTLTDNGDGTYDLTLSVTGRSSSSTTSSKADIVIVFDKSGSMNDHIQSDTGSMGYSSSSDTYFSLYKKEGPWWYPQYTEISDSDNYTGTVYYSNRGNFSEYGGQRYTTETCLPIAKSAVNSLAEQLLSNNGNNTDVNTANVTLSLITFSNNSSKDIERTATLSTFTNAVNDITATGGTNWEAALQEAYAISGREGATKYVIFVSDGNPTFRNTYIGDNGSHDSDYYYQYGVYGSGSTDPKGYNYEAARGVVANIGSNFYGVGVFGNVTNMQNLVTASGADSTHYQSASDQNSLNAAFANIIKSITNSSTFKSITMTDNITDLTATSLVTGSTSGFRYERNGVTWEDAPEASFSEVSDGTGKQVTWNLGNTVVENGVTYSVTFTVWPSQEAYDLLASLNNGTTYDSLSDNQKAQIIKNSDGTYSLWTNTESGNTISYTKVDSVTDENGNTTETETSGTSTFTNPDPIALHAVKLKITKKWEDSAYYSNRPDSITMQVKQDDANYKTVTLTGEATASEWTAEIYVAPGIYVEPGTRGTASTGDDAGILETGHTYTVEEIGYTKNGTSYETSDYHYELSFSPVRPMMNGLTTNDKTDLINQLPNYEVTTNYEATLTATNSLRGGIQITKKVYTNDSTNENPTDISDNDGVKDTEFTFTLDTLTLPTGKSLDSSKENYIGSDYVNANGKYVVWAERIGTNGEKLGDSFTIGAGDTFTLKPNETLRLTNIPIGTAYSISENTTSLVGYEYWQTKASQNDSDLLVVTSASGTTTGNVNYQYEFDNKQNLTSIVIKKTTGDFKTGIASTTFRLYKVSSSVPSGEIYQIDGKDDFVVSDANAGYTITDLPVGTYRLQERVAPDGYIIEIADTYFTVSIGSDGKGVITLSDTNKNSLAQIDSTSSDTLLIGNKAGKALPNTGGPGTIMFTLCGLLLIMGAALMYGFVSRRRRERRLR